MTALTKSRALNKAFQKACSILNINKACQLILLSIDDAIFDEYAVSGFLEDSSQYKVQCHTVEMYQVLYKLFGGDTEAMQHWFYSRNKELDAVPSKLSNEPNGLIQINHYLNNFINKC